MTPEAILARVFLKAQQLSTPVLKGLGVWGLGLGFGFCWLPFGICIRSKRSR